MSHLTSNLSFPYIISMVWLITGCSSLESLDRPYHLRNWEQLHVAARTAYQAGKLDRFEALSLRAVSHAEKIGKSDFHLLVSLTDLAKAYRYNKKYKQAESTYKQAIKEAEHMSQSSVSAVDRKLLAQDWARGLTGLAEVYIQEDELQKAGAVYKEALMLYEKQGGGQNNGSGDTLSLQEKVDVLAGLASVYALAKNTDVAEKYYKQSLDLANSCAYPKIRLAKIRSGYLKIMQSHQLDVPAQKQLAQALWKQHAQDGIKFQKRHEWKQAESSFLMALAESRKIGNDSPEYIATLESLAKVFSSQEKYSQAAESAGLAYSTLKNSDAANDRRLESLLDLYTESLMQAHDFKSAIPALKEQLDLSNSLQGKESKKFGITSAQLSLAYHKAGENSKAAQPARDAYLIFVDQPHMKERVLVVQRWELARLFHDLRDYKRAEPMYQQALAFHESKNKPADNLRVVAILYDLSSVYRDAGESAKAREAFRKATEMQKQVAPYDLFYLAKSKTRIAERYWMQKKYRKAEPWINHALTDAEAADRAGANDGSRKRYVMEKLDTVIKGKAGNSPHINSSPH